MKKLTRTFLRTEKTMNLYKKYRDEKNKEKQDFGFDEKIIKTFEYWKIIKNKFPYDAIAEVSHMMVPIRKVIFSWKKLNAQEKKELYFLKENYLSKKYDAVYESLPTSQSVPGYFHLHLLKLKRENF